MDQTPSHRSIGNGTMKRWLVQSGEIYEIVEADTSAEAIKKVFTLFDDCEDIPIPGQYIWAIEVVGEEVFWSTIEALKAADRWGGKINIDANTANRSSNENHPSTG